MKNKELMKEEMKRFMSDNNYSEEFKRFVIENLNLALGLKNTLDAWDKQGKE